MRSPPAATRVTLLAFYHCHAQIKHRKEGSREIREETWELSPGFGDPDQSEWTVLGEDRELKGGWEAGSGRMPTEATLFKSCVGKVSREVGNH